LIFNGLDMLHLKYHSRMQMMNKEISTLTTGLIIKIAQKRLKKTHQMMQI